MKKLSTTIIGLSAIMFAGAVSAAPIINGGRPYDSGNLSSLQAIFDASTDTEVGAGVTAVDAIADQSSIAGWGTSEGDVDAYVVSLVTPTTGSLGIYSIATGAEALLLTTSAAESETFSISNSGTLTIGTGFGATTIAGFGDRFGFYWVDTGLKSYTEDSKNAGDILALSYLLEGGTTVEYGNPQNPSYPSNLTTFVAADSSTGTPNDWILAFDDANGGSPDGDFVDAVFLIEDMAVPEPTTVAMLSLGLLGFGVAARRRNRINA